MSVCNCGLAGLFADQICTNCGNKVRTAWGRYLEVRLEMIAEWTIEGRSPHEIVHLLATDPFQIQLLQDRAMELGMITPAGRAEVNKK